MVVSLTLQMALYVKLERGASEMASIDMITRSTKYPQWTVEITIGAFVFIGDKNGHNMRETKQRIGAVFTLEPSRATGW